MNSIVRLFRLFNKKDFWAMGGLAALMLVAALLETVGVAFIFPLMSIITEPEIIQNSHILSSLYGWLGMTSDRQFIFFLGGMFFLMFLLKNIFMVAMLHVQAAFLAARRYFLHTRLYNAYLTSPYLFHLQNNSAVLMRNIDEIGTVFQNVFQPLLQIMTDSLIILFLAGMLIFHNAKVAFVIVFFIGGSALGINVFLRKSLRALGAVRVHTKADMFQLFFQGLRGIKDVQVLQRQKQFINRYAEAMDRFLQANRKTSVLQQLPRLIMEVLMIGGMLLIIFILMVQKYDMTQIIPTLSLFALGTFRLMPSLNRIVMSVNQLHYNQEVVGLVISEFERLGDAGSHEWQKKEGEGFEENLLAFQKELKLDQVSFRYPNRQEAVIKEISLILRKGEAIAFAGSSGSGKTTLIDIILGLLPPESGRILVDGQDIQGNMKSWRRHIGYVAQFIFIADDTVRSNVAFGIAPDEINDAAVEQALRAAQLWEVVQELPEGLDTILGENGVRLSGGQRQRIGIARALYHNPEVLILDEATSSLDGETEYEVTRAIDQLSQSKTLIVIAHRLSTVKKCDTIYFMQEGEIVDQGSFDELMTRNDQFSKMANLVSF